MSRRTLSTLSESDINSRFSIDAIHASGIKKSQEFAMPRQSMAPSKMQNGFNNTSNNSRLSVSGNLNMSINQNNSNVNSRRTSIMPAQTPSIKKEGNKYSDKDYQRVLIKHVIEFLQAHQYPCDISVQSLILPGNKDVANILRFAISLIDPQYDIKLLFPLQMKEELAKLQKNAHMPEIKKQLERLKKEKVDQKGYDDDMLLALLQYLRYPGTLDKKRLAVNPHNWGYLLAAISWFTDLLMYSTHRVNTEVQQIKMLMQQPDEQNDHKNPGAALLFEFVRQGYTEWMRDEMRGYTVVKTIWENEFAKRNKNTLLGIQACEEEKKQLALEIEMYQAQERRLKQLENDKMSLEKSIHESEQTLQSLDVNKRKLEHESDVQDHELRHVKSELSKYLRERDLLKKQVDSQDIRPEDVMRINQDKNQLEEHVRQLNATLDSLSKELFEAENRLSEETDRLLTKSAKEYNRLASTLSHRGDDDMHDDEEEPNNAKFELLITPGNLNQCTFSTTNIDLREAASRITVMTQDLGTQCSSTEKQLHDVDEQLDAGTEEMELLHEDIAELEKRLKKHENQYNTEKQNCRNDLQKGQMEVEREEEEIANLQNQLERLKIDAIDSERLHDQLRNELAILRKQQEQEKKVMNEHIIRILERLTQHKDYLNRIIASVEEKCRETLTDIKRMD